MKVFLSTLCLCSLLVASLFVGQVHAQEAGAQNQKKLTAQIGIVFDEVYLRLEAFRIKGAAYFLKIRDEKKAALGIGDLPKSPRMDLGVATEVPEKEMAKQYIELDNPLDYVVYVGASSMATLFGNKSVFYITLILLILIIIRTILIRIKYSA